MTSPQNFSQDKLDLAVYNAIRYLDDVTSMETELGVVYTEVESVIRSARRIMSGESEPEPESLAKDLAHP